MRIHKACAWLLWSLVVPVMATAAPAVPASSTAANTISVSATDMTQPVLPSFDDRFSVKWNGISAGDMQVRLQAQAGQPGCYVDRATTDPNVLAKAIYGAPQQTSVFCVVDGHIQTHTYRYEVPGRSQDSYSLSFDWKHHTVTDGHGKVRTIPDDAIDSLALQQAVRLWLLKHAKDAKPPEAHFTLVDDHHLTHYRFKLAGRHIVDTPAGRFDAWLMERVDNPDKVGKYWIAPARNYLPVASETRNSSAAVLTTMLEP